MTDPVQSAIANAQQAAASTQAALLTAQGVLSSTIVAINQIAAAYQPPAPALAKYGISTGYKILSRVSADQGAELDSVKAVGATNVRLDSTPSNQNLLDTTMGLALARGLKPLLVLYGTTGVRAADTFGHDQAVKWAGKCNIFEICNEPDLHGWTPDQYADFVKATAASIRAGNPNAKVVAGALWKGITTGASPQPFVKSLATRAAGSFDYVSLHLYDDALARGSWNIWDMAYPWTNGSYNGNTCREILDAAGLSAVPLISTESGGPVTSYTEAQQATIVKDALGQVQAGKLASCFVYAMRDDATTGFGLLRPDLTQRPSYAAYAAAAALG